MDNPKHYKSVFDTEQELLTALFELHNNGASPTLDPMFFKGNFYKNRIARPLFVSDLNPQFDYVERADATKLDYSANSMKSIMLDPPFIFGIHGKEGKGQKNYYSSRTHTIFKDFAALESTYKGILREAHRILKPKGVLFFKCQDYTDAKTTMTHCFVWQWATDLGFYTKDLAILVKPNKVYNGNTNQRHLRKIHTYFFVLIKN